MRSALWLLGHLPNALCAVAAPSGVPQFVLDYAPIVLQHPQDPYHPSDIGAQLTNTSPKLGYDAISNAPSPLTLSNLDQLNGLGGTGVFLTSNEDATKLPAWLHGVNPDGSGVTNGATSSTIIVVDKGNGVVDAFYFYFYAYNWGGITFGLEFGDHVGDWEHNMIRFQNGVPDAVWYSQHARGQAFKYAALDKDQLRPIVYSANGSHANYALDGLHDHTIPLPFNLPFDFIITDHTSKGGPKLDPILNAYYYSYDISTQTFTAYDGVSPTNWLYFNGQWGDKAYKTGDRGQYEIFDQYKYSDGPNGPAFKDLARTNVCPSSISDCIISGVILPRSA